MTCRRTLALLALSFLAVPAARADEASTQRQLDDLRKEIELNRKLIRGLAELGDLNRRLTELERRVDEMQHGQGRVSRFPPQTGLIRLENRLSVPATIIVDGVPQRLQPGERRDLRDVPAGDFTFEALVDGYGSLQPRATRKLLAGQVYTIFTYLP